MSSSGEAARARSPRSGDGKAGRSRSPRSPVTNQVSANAAVTTIPAGASSNWTDNVEHLSQNFDGNPADSPTRPPFVPSTQDQTFSAIGEAHQENPGIYSPESFWAQATALPYQACHFGSRAAAHTRFKVTLLQWSVYPRPHHGGRMASDGCKDRQ